MPDRVGIPFACGFIGSFLGLICGSYIIDPCLSIMIGGGTGAAMGCAFCTVSCYMNPACKKPLPIASTIEPVIHVYTGEEKYVPT
jgi:hypothetical protein